MLTCRAHGGLLLALPCRSSNYSAARRERHQRRGGRKQQLLFSMLVSVDGVECNIFHLCQAAQSESPMFCPISNITCYRTGSSCLHSLQSVFAQCPISYSQQIKKYCLSALMVWNGMMQCLFNFEFSNARNWLRQHCELGGVQVLRHQRGGWVGWPNDDV